MVSCLWLSLHCFSKMFGATWASSDLVYFICQAILLQNSARQRQFGMQWKWFAFFVSVKSIIFQLCSHCMVKEIKDLIFWLKDLWVCSLEASSWFGSEVSLLLFFHFRCSCLFLSFSVFFDNLSSLSFSALISLECLFLVLHQLPTPWEKSSKHRQTQILMVLTSHGVDYFILFHICFS